MNYSVEEFRPSNPNLIIDHQEIELNLLTLHIDAKFKEKVDRLENIFADIKKRPSLLFELIWILVIDKSRFKFSYKIFQDFIFSEGATFRITQDAMEKISEVIAKSMPLVKNSARYEELKKISNMQREDDGKPCYGVYYDTIAKRYGYTIDQFYGLTLRQLHILLTVIGDKSYEEIEIQAALQGKKLRPKMKPLDIEEKEDKKLDDDAKELHERLMKEYKEKQGII